MSGGTDRHLVRRPINRCELAGRLVRRHRCQTACRERCGGSGSSSLSNFLGFSRVFGSTKERNKTGLRTDEDFLERQNEADTATRLSTLSLAMELRFADLAEFPSQYRPPRLCSSSGSAVSPGACMTLPRSTTSSDVSCFEQLLIGP